MVVHSSPLTSHFFLCESNLRIQYYNYSLDIALISWPYLLLSKLLRKKPSVLIKSTYNVLLLCSCTEAAEHGWKNTIILLIFTSNSWLYIVDLWSLITLFKWFLVLPATSTTHFSNHLSTHVEVYFTLSLSSKFLITSLYFSLLADEWAHTWS